MGTPYIGEIRMFGGNFAPAGWEFCSGQLIPISENDALFTLIGTTYGGDGQNNFALPDLRGRVPVHQGRSSLTGTTYVIGQSAGVESVTLSVSSIPSHTHAVLGTTSSATDEGPSSNTIPAQISGALYEELTPIVPMNAVVVSPQGGSQPHNNMQPYLVVSFIISMYGVFPSQT